MALSAEIRAILGVCGRLGGGGGVSDQCFRITKDLGGVKRLYTSLFEAALYVSRAYTLLRGIPIG